MITMDQGLKIKVKSALNKCNMAVNGMMAPDTADEEKGAWVQIYNYNMAKLLNEYLADEPVEALPQDAPAPQATSSAEAEEPAEDVGPITNAE